MEEKFTQHLIDIGIIDKKAERQFLYLYKEINPSYKTSNYKFNEIMTKILINFFDNMTEVQKKFICFHLPAKFIKLTKNLLNRKLKNIIEKIILKKQWLLIKYLFRWNKNINESNKNIFHYDDKKLIQNGNDFNRKTNSKINKYIKDYFLNNNLSHKKYINDEDYYGLLNDENDYLSINNQKRSKTYNNSKDKNNLYKANNLIRNLYDKNNYMNINNVLNKNNFISDKKINKKKININNLLSRKDSNESNYNLISSTNTNTTNNNNYNSKTDQSFTHKCKKEFNINNSFNMKSYCNKKYIPILFDDNKQIKEKKNFIKNKGINLDKIKLDNFIDDNLNNYDYSFIPTIKVYKRNNNFINNKKVFSTYKDKDNNKLIKTFYSKIFHPPFGQSDKIPKKNNQLTVYNRLFEDGKNRIKKQKQKKFEQDKYIDDLSNQISGDKKKVDYKRLNNLFFDKERNKSFQKTKIKVEEEEGLTFKPYINKTDYIKRIYSNFMERNYYNNNNNNKYLNEYNYINNYNINLNSQKKMNKKQKEKIINRILNQLNVNHLSKNMPNYCNKYTKEVKNNIKINKIKL